ncbi:MAG: AAA family ATPase [Promethearchaeota archaeon]
MIETIELKNFKSNRDTVLKLKKINLLIGPNNAGKSSIGEALKIMKQTAFNDYLLKGPLVTIPIEDRQSIIYHGKKKSSEFEIKIFGTNRWNWIDNQNMDASQYNMNLIFNEKMHIFDLTYDLIHRLKFKFNKTIQAGRGSSSSGQLFHSNNRIDGDYIPDVHYGPESNLIFQEKYLIKKLNNLKSQDYFKTYANKRRYLPISETYFEFLHKFFIFDEIYEKTKMQYPLAKESMKDWLFIESKSLSEILTTAFWKKETLDNVQKYMRKIFEDDNLEVEFDVREGFILKIYIKRKGISYNFSNEGAGIKQILFTLLKFEFLPDNSTLFFNEPECYIDVNRQHQLIKSLIKQAKRKNLQIIFSTHSEHILYGLIDLIKNDDISVRDLSVYSFTLDKHYNSPTTNVKAIEITENGDFDDMPGFSDISIKEAEISLKLKKKKIQVDLSKF